MWNFRNLLSKRETMSDCRHAGTPQKIMGHKGHRRDVCFWEPIFSPGFELDPVPWDWDLERDAGPSGRFILGEALQARIVPGDTFTIKKVTFKNCDFQGIFRPDPLLMFEGCQFIGCDFAFSNWHGAHFKSCSFTQCSLSLCALSSCDFRDCSWDRVGLASKTEMTRTIFSNPSTLIQSMVSGTDPKNPSIKHALSQWYRLQGTRAHVLRNIMISHQSSGDEHTYYEVVKLHELNRSFAKLSLDIFDLIFGNILTKFISLLKLAIHGLDYLILRLFGFLNNWGESASRPLFSLVSCFFIFSWIYKYYKFGIPIENPLQKSFEITSLVGYTNQTISVTPELSLVQDIHVVFSITIYSIFFATVVSKLSRAR